MAIANLGHEARSFTGSQAGVITDSVHGKARIIDVTPGRIRQALDDGHIAIVAGFQGVSQDTKDITTLGRGGSDTTAVALAAALGADVCEIYTDVDGVFTADPRIVPDRPPDRPHHAARRCWRWRPPAPRSCTCAASSTPGGSACRSTCARRSATARAPGSPTPARPEEESPWSSRSSPASRTTAARPRSPWSACRTSPARPREIFEAVAAAEINIDMIVQNVSAAATGLTDISFTLPKTDGQTAMAALTRVQAQVGFDSLLYDDQIGKVSLIGAGMRSHPGVSARFFTALADAGVNIEMISTSEIRISVVTRADRLDDAVRAVHTAFGLDSADGEAVVYGGTGR